MKSVQSNDPLLHWGISSALYLLALDGVSDLRLPGRYVREWFYAAHPSLALSSFAQDLMMLDVVCKSSACLGIIMPSCCKTFIKRLPHLRPDMVKHHWAEQANGAGWCSFHAGFLVGPAYPAGHVGRCSPRSSSQAPAAAWSRPPGWLAMGSMGSIGSRRWRWHMWHDGHARRRWRVEQTLCATKRAPACHLISRKQA